MSSFTGLMIIVELFDSLKLDSLLLLQFRFTNTYINTGNILSTVNNLTRNFP